MGLPARAALRAALQSLSVDDVEAFYRTFVKIDHALAVPRVGAVMDKSN